MVNETDFVDAFSEVLEYSQPVRFRYFNASYGAGSYYDDDITLTQSGNDVWASGLVLPIDQSRGSSDAVLLEQGELLTDDTKLYVKGTCECSGTYKIGLGSPPVSEYSVLNAGNITWDVNDTSIFNKVYIRRLPTGSLVGEQ